MSLACTDRIIVPLGTRNGTQDVELACQLGMGHVCAHEFVTEDENHKPIRIRWSRPIYPKGSNVVPE